MAREKETKEERALRKEQTKAARASFKESKKTMRLLKKQYEQEENMKADLNNRLDDLR